jgi:NTP pyrophosphatase (non-canonical NTP hydrolase)
VNNGATRSISLHEISKCNRKRAQRWHDGGGEWHASDWSNALAGEGGELADAIIDVLALTGRIGALCNTVKKVRRHETHVDKIAGGQGSYNTPDMPALEQRVKDEIADVFLYLDLVASHFGLDLEECIFPKFNRVSETQGFPERLGE